MTQATEIQEATREFVQRVVGLPEAQRLPAMTARLREYALLDPMARAATMRSVMVAVADLPSDDRWAFLRTRALAFVELPISTRMALTGTRIEVFQELPAQRVREEAEVLEALLPGLEPPRQLLLRQMLNVTRSSQAAAAKSATSDRRTARNRPWWQFWRS